MNYIRTKDGIFEVKKVEILCGVKFYDYETREDFVNRIREEQIIAQADTIEELCDGFYLDLGGEFDDTYLRRKDRFEFLKELALEYMRRDMKVTLYGLIKTNKGLIYVAKMNDRGELELI